MPGRTIDQIIDELGEVVAKSREERSRLGYFAAMYRRVTVRVKQGIAAGEFEDGARMERLDVAFADRYLDAYRAYHADEPLTASWRVAFDATRRWRPLVIQHLFSGMNAHINLDLPIAAAAVAPGEAIPGLEEDFRRINLLLRQLTTGVHADLAAVFPLLAAPDVMAGGVWNMLAGRGISVARGVAWGAAVRLATVPSDDLPAEIERQDERVAGLGRRILSPSPLSNVLTMGIRLGEWKRIRGVIDVLAKDG